MPRVQIEGVSQETIDALKDQAAIERRSYSAHVRLILDRAAVQAPKVREI